MKYLEIDFTLHCDAGLLETARDLLADAAGEAGLESFEDTPQGLKGFAQKELFDNDVLQQATQDLMPGVTVAYAVRELEDRDWNHAWEEAGFDTINIDNRVVIYDARHQSADDIARPEGAIVVGIEPTQAFGSGTHETTQLVIGALLRQDLHGRCVLDCGCGTGILGITAAKLGAKEVVGYDLDEWSVDNAKSNARLNQVDNFQVLFGNASVLSHVSGLFGVVVANINRNVLLQDMPAFKEVMESGGRLILSGFYEQDISQLLEVAHTLGFSEQARTTKGSWCCLDLTL